MSRCRYALTGAAPINQEILILFQSLNIPLFEGYGMTEDSAGASINYFEKNKIGTVGPALPGTEIKILSDGEIVIKNPSQQISKLKELGHSLEDYTESDEIKKEIQSQVDLINTTFSSPEQVKKFEILPRDFTVDEKELTPTLKLRRKKILQNWNTIINKIYE